MTGSKASRDHSDFITGSDPQPASEASKTEQTAAEEHIEDAALDSDNGSAGPNLHKKGALGFIKQQHIIPTTGNVMPTGKWEYIFFCIYCKFVQGFDRRTSRPLTTTQRQTFPTMAPVSG